MRTDPTDAVGVDARKGIGIPVFVTYGAGKRQDTGARDMSSSTVARILGRRSLHLERRNLLDTLLCNPGQLMFRA